MSALVAVSVIAIAASVALVATVLVNSLQTLDKTLVGGTGFVLETKATLVRINNTGVLGIEFPATENVTTLVQGVAYVTKKAAGPRTAFGSGNATSPPTFRLLESGDMPQIAVSQVVGIVEVIQGGRGTGDGLLGGLLIVSSINGTIVEGLPRLIAVYRRLNKYQRWSKRAMELVLWR